MQAKSKNAISVISSRPYNILIFPTTKINHVNFLTLCAAATFSDLKQMNRKQVRESFEECLLRVKSRLYLDIENCHHNLPVTNMKTIPYFAELFIKI